MKTNIKRVIVAALMSVAIGFSLTSCTPEEVDAFAEGYREGYYGSW